MIKDKLKETSLEGQCSSASLLQYSTSSSISVCEAALHWLAPNREMQLWVVTEKTSQCLWFSPCCFQFYTQQWWERSQCRLALKGRAKQHSIKKSIICYRASVRRIPLSYNTPLAALITLCCWCLSSGNLNIKVLILFIQIIPKFTYTLASNTGND